MSNCNGSAVAKKRVFSGIQPTGIFTLGNYLGALKNWVRLQNDCECIYSVVNMHAITVRQDPAELRENTLSALLGNYLGALKNWVRLQNDCECIYSVVNMHAITVRQDPAELRENTLSALALYMACGVDPEKSIIFVQSDVCEHAELGWILNCYTPYGELSRMTQFKDKSSRYEDNINAGLFTYPSLMAADILLYSTDLVPVGDDQRQHLELARDIVIRFNGIYGDVFKMPDPYIPANSVGARVMSLQTPTKKMSKSDTNPKGFISILDEPSVIVKKVKSAVTDSDGRICYAEGKDGVNNLLRILSAVDGRNMHQLEQHFEGKGYGVLKLEVAEALVSELAPIQKRYAELVSDKGQLLAIARAGAERARSIAKSKLDEVKGCVGFLA